MFPSSHSSSSFSPFILSNSHSDFNCKGWEKRQERDPSKESHVDPHRSLHPHLLSSFFCLLSPPGMSSSPSTSPKHNTFRSQFSPHLQRGLGSLGWVLSAQCWTCHPAYTACYSSSSRTTAVGKEEFRGSITREGSKTNLSPNHHLSHLLPPA